MLLTTIKTALVAIFALLTAEASGEFVMPVPAPLPLAQVAETPLATQTLSLANRHAVPRINEVFKKNILLNLAYLDSTVTKKADIVWDNILAPRISEFTLQPGETFAYHDDLLPEYASKTVVTTKAHFNAQEGFVSSGFLYGDGVCHLASVINRAAQEAGLAVVVTKLHTIAHIPDVPDEYGVSIYTIAGKKGSGARNNLYITNNQDSAVTFRFEYDGSDSLRLLVRKSVIPLADSSLRSE